MNSWHSNTLPYSGGHQRSVSAVGYHEAMYPYDDKIETIQIPKDNRLSNQYCASYMDISNTGTTSNDSRRQFSWRSPASNPSNNKNSEKSRHFSVQRPFESAFKAAISKMKESSIYRLNDVDKNARNMSHGTTINNDSYNRNCMTLQSKRTAMDSRVPIQSNKIFRCNSTSERARDGLASVSMLPCDYVSETDSYRADLDNIRRSFSNLVSNECKFQDEKVSGVHRTNGGINGFKINCDSRVIIPATPSSHSSHTESKSSVISEAFISPTTVTKSQSVFPKMNHCSMDMEENTDCEPLPSVQEIIAKVEALTNDSKDQIMSKSLVLTTEKPPLKKLQKSNSQRALDGYSTSSQSEQSPSQEKRMSGVYKKNNPTPPKAISVNKMPFDFQKLHSAFLEQKQEIQHLKQELEEKKTYIIQLESEIRNYEPWR